MKFFQYFAFIALLVLFLAASSEAGFGKHFKKELHKAGHKVESAGKHAAHTIHKTANAVDDAGKIALAGAAVAGALS